jgi:hypothetical protein
MLYLHGKNGGEILIGYTLRVGYTYRADCKNIGNTFRVGYTYRADCKKAKRKGGKCRRKRKKGERKLEKGK